MTPKDLKYTKEHDWVRIRGDEAEIGITDYAQQELGDITYVEIPETGKELKTMEVFADGHVKRSEFIAATNLEVQLPAGGPLEGTLQVPQAAYLLSICLDNDVVVLQPTVRRGASIRYRGNVDRLIVRSRRARRS